MYTLRRVEPKSHVAIKTFNSAVPMLIQNLKFSVLPTRWLVVVSTSVGIQVEFSPDDLIGSKWKEGEKKLISD